MASRIGGPSASLLFTWASVRSPLVWSGAVLSTPPSYHQTTYSRAFPDTTSDPYPKFFIWESGSLFSWNRHGGFGSTIPPYYWIEGYLGDEEADPPVEDQSFFGVGFTAWPVDRVDNYQFKELIGEEVDTDGGTFTITQDAHSITGGAAQYIPGIYATEIYTIGKLTPV
jgi:hypothetical protein